MADTTTPPTAFGMTPGNITALQVGGMAMSAIGSYFGAKSQASALEFQAALSDINAKMEENYAQQAMILGNKQQTQIKLHGARVKSAQKVSMAANGIDLGSQVAVNNLTDTDLGVWNDANTARLNAIQSAWGHRMQGTNMSNAAMINRATASGINPAMSATSSLLSNGGQVASSWYMMKKMG